MMSKALPDKESWVPRVRETMQDQARWFALLYRSLCKYLPPDIVEQACREAIRKFGQLKAIENSGEMSPSLWVEKQEAQGTSLIFEAQIIRNNEICEQRRNFCPLVEAWKEMGCSKKEIGLFCSIISEEDQGRAEKSGISLEVTSRIGKGENHCCLVLKKMK
jgi:hypothetical protein